MFGGVHVSAGSADLHGGVRNFQCFRDGVHNRLQHRVGGEAGLQPPAQQGQHPIRFVAMTVEQSVD